jgi:O-methyltransferase involved in polyketide biosynthesis
VICLSLYSVGRSNIRWGDETLPAELADVEPRWPERMPAMTGYSASRTCFLDSFFRVAAAAGVRQAMILTVGLDPGCGGGTGPASAVV